MDEDLYTVDAEAIIDETSKNLMLSINAMEGSQGSGTSKIIGRYKDRQLMILVDTGSIKSFVDRKVADDLKIPLEKTPQSTVTVADGRKMHCMRRCKGFKWVVQTYSFCFDTRILELGGFDVILGVDWLQSFNPVLFDFHGSRIILSDKKGKIVL